MDESLKEYLVKIGFKLDELGLSDVNNKLNGFESKIASSGSKVLTSLLGAGSVLGTFFSTAIGLTADLMDKTAQADLRVEKLARQYAVSETKMRSYSNAVKQLNLDMDDLAYITKEEYQHLIELNAQGQRLEPPEGLQSTLFQIREINFQFTKFRTTLSYFKDWIVYYLGQYLGTDLEDINNKLGKLNELVIQKMPIAAEKIARVLSYCYQLIKSTYEFFEMITSRFSNLFSNLGLGGVKAIGLIGSAILLLKSGPLGWMIAAITGLLLLIDDYMTWKRGGISAIDWGGGTKSTEEYNQNLDDLRDKLGQIVDKFATIKDSLVELKDNAVLLLDAVVDVTNAFLNLFGLDIKSFANNFINNGLSLVNVAVHSLSSVLQQLTNYFNFLSGNISFKELNQLEKQRRNEQWDIFSDFIKQIFSPESNGIGGNNLTGILGDYGNTEPRMIAHYRRGEVTYEYEGTNTVNINLPNVTNPQQFANEISKDEFVDTLTNNLFKWSKVSSCSR